MSNPDTMKEQNEAEVAKYRREYHEMLEGFIPPTLEGEDREKAKQALTHVANQTLAFASVRMDENKDAYSMFMCDIILEDLHRILCQEKKEV